MSNELDIRNLVFHKNEYTNCFLISCIKYTWKFNLNNKTHIIFLFFTKLFGKRQIFLDSKKIYDKTKFTYNFKICFPVEYYNVTICQKDDCYILKINDISFNKILNDLKIKKFNILEDNYKIKQEEKKKKRLQKLKNKILLETVKNFEKEEKNVVKKNLNKNEKNEEDDSKTIHQSFEINEKDLDTLNKLNNFNNNINKKNNNGNNKDKKNKKDKKRKKKFKPNEKKNIYKNMENSYSDMIDYDSLVYESIISGDNRSTDICQNNNSNSSKYHKDSTKTESK